VRTRVHCVGKKLAARRAANAKPRTPRSLESVAIIRNSQEGKRAGWCCVRLNDAVELKQPALEPLSSGIGAANGNNGNQFRASLRPPGTRQAGHLVLAPRVRQRQIPPRRTPRRGRDPLRVGPPVARYLTRRVGGESRPVYQYLV